MEVNRAHDAAVVAVHKDTGMMFGGKKKGTHVGYSKIGDLKAAMTIAKVPHEDYQFYRIMHSKTVGFSIALLES